MSAPCTVLAIDGGGTKTTAALAEASSADQLRQLGEGSSGPSNPLATSTETAIRALEDAVDKAFTAAAVDPHPVAAAVIALAGSDREPIRSCIRDWANERRLADRVEVVTDAAPILRAGSSEGWGVALIAGTGSLAWGRSSHGATVRAGGWGYLCGDEGSSYALAVAGIRAALAAAEARGPATALVDALVEALDVANLPALVQSVYDAELPRVAIASLAPAVVAASTRGDSVAAQLVDDAGRELARLVGSVARRLQFEGPPFPLAGTGGLLLAAPRLRRSLEQALQAEGVRAAPLSLVEAPIDGALQLAADLSRAS